MSRSGRSPVGSSSSTWRLYFKSASRGLDPPSSACKFSSWARPTWPQLDAAFPPGAAVGDRYPEKLGRLIDKG
jgi:hypothetical protein